MKIRIAFFYDIIFSYDADHTYYQVMFESPDQILFEVVYMAYPGNTMELTE